MKILFLMALFLNIIAFLWEYNNRIEYVDVNSEIRKEKPLKILLLSELEKETQKGEGENIIKLISLTELNLPIVSGSKAVIVKKNSEDITKNYLSSPIEKILESKPNLDTTENVNNNTVNKINNAKGIEKSQRNIQKQLKRLNSDGKQIEADSSLMEKELINIKKTEVTNSVCYQIGPFVNTALIGKWSDTNKIAKNTIRIINHSEKKEIRYFVYFPAEKTFQQSKDNLKMLREKGVSEFWLIRKGVLKGMISLGLFSRERGAEKLQEKLSKKGIKTYIKQRFKMETVYSFQLQTNDKDFKNKIKIKRKQKISECKSNDQELIEQIGG